MVPEGENQPEKKKRKRAWWERIGRFLFGFMVFLFCLIVAFFFVIELDSVQNFLKDKVVDYFAKKWNTTVQVDHVDFSLFTKVNLDGFFIEDERGDTLVYVDELRVGIGKGLVDGFSSILSQEYEIGSLELTGAYLNYYRDSVYTDSNASFLFSNEEKDSATVTLDTAAIKGGLLLDVDNVTLNDVRIRSHDKLKGELIEFDIGLAYVDSLYLSSKEKKLRVSSVNLNGLYAGVTKFQKQLDDGKEKEIEPSKWDDVPEDYHYFTAEVDEIKLRNGKFMLDESLKEFTRVKYENTMDFTDLKVHDIEMDIENFTFREDLRFNGKVTHVQAEEQCGFRLEEGFAEDIQVTCEGFHLNGVELRTPNSVLSDTIEFKYRRNGYYSFWNFEEDVTIIAKINKGSRLALKDIFTFAPELQSNRFFLANKNEVIDLKGEIRGRINRLRTKDFSLKIGNGLVAEGDLRSRDLNVKGEEFLDFELKRLNTDVKTLRKLVPDLVLPPQFDKLGRIRFEGRFLGFFTDFVADGYLKTDLGDVKSDMNLKGSGKNATYSGNIALIDFDMGQWMGDDQFGKVNFSSTVKNGRGLNVNEIYADLQAEVKEFNFKGYTYRLLDIEGKFDLARFEGNAEIRDPNIDMSFDGVVDFNDSIPDFDFVADVRKVKFKNLNLTKRVFELSGDLDLNFKGLKLDEIQGEASAKGMEFLVDSILLEVDSVYAYSRFKNNGVREVGVRSEVISGDVSGNFDFEDLPKTLIGFATRNFPKLSERIGLKPNYEKYPGRRFDFDIFIPNSENFTQLLDPRLDTIKEASLRGFFDYDRDTLFLDVEIGKAGYGDFIFKSTNIFGQFQGNEGYTDLGIYHTVYKDSLHIPNILLFNTLHSDTLDFELNASNFSDVLDHLNLEGSLVPSDKKRFKVTFKPSNLVVYNQKWDILKDNFVIFGKDYIETENFRLSNLEFPSQMVELNSIGDKGLSVTLQEFDLSVVNDFTNYEPLQFSGPLNVIVSAENVFKVEKLNLEAEMDSFLINEDNFGVLELKANSPDIKSPIELTLEISDPVKSLKAEGYYRPPYLEKNKNLFLVDVDIENYPLTIGHYFLGENITDTEGTVSADVRFSGTNVKPEIRGQAFIKDGATTIDYLKTRLFIPNDTVNIRPGIFDFSGVQIYDKDNNVAVATGGITNNNFKQLGLDVSLKSDNFIAMDTGEDDNDLFYGRAEGKMDLIKFTGDFKNPNIEVVATTGPNTKIFLPLSGTSSGSELSFITFNDAVKEKEEEFIEQFITGQAEGMNLSMDVTITPESEVQLIFDEKAGDILRGKGTGFLQIDFTREGEFTMEGEYIVEEGSYLFTLLNVVNKPFVIKKGGTINWSGDPYSAIIDIDATYDKLSTTPYNFILEYLNNEGDKSEAQKTTPIELTMHLEGELFKPDITFDIAFPNLRGRMKNFTDSKLRIIEEDENELNRQVLGLIAFGSFFPSDMAYSNTGILDGGINTLSELLSNQLSIYLSELLSEVITDVDFDINYRYYELTDVSDFNPDELSRSTGSELEIRLTKRLFNNRLSINAGGNFDVDGGENGAFLAGDLLIEYLLTPDGRFKLRFYQESEQTIAATRENRTGFGLTYSREFDSFRELFKGETQVYNSYEEFKARLQELKEQ